VFTCIGAPVRHPISGAVEGVLDVTCGVDDRHDLLKPVVLAAVREIESRMYADASRREQLLLEHFLRARRRATTAVVSLNEDVVMANTAASVLLDLSDRGVPGTGPAACWRARDEYTGESGSRTTWSSGEGDTGQRPRGHGGRVLNAPVRPRPPPARPAAASGRRRLPRRLRDGVDAAVPPTGRCCIAGRRAPASCSSPATWRRAWVTARRARRARRA
jgi:hypothetical protein